jgi:hypothetical protein
MRTECQKRDPWTPSCTQNATSPSGLSDGSSYQPAEAFPAKHVVVRVRGLWSTVDQEVFEALVISLSMIVGDDSEITCRRCRSPSGTIRLRHSLLVAKERSRSASEVE